MVQIALELTAQHVLAQEHELGAWVALVTLQLDHHATFAALIGDLGEADRELDRLGDHPSRIRKKIRITYQNISATDENSASDAATCWFGS